MRISQLLLLEYVCLGQVVGAVCLELDINMQDGVGGDFWSCIFLQVCIYCELFLVGNASEWWGSFKHPEWLRTLQ